MKATKERAVYYCAECRQALLENKHWNEDATLECVGPTCSQSGAKYLRPNETIELVKAP
jgi:hypothetical protein